MLLGFKLNLGDLADAIYQECYIFSKFCCDLFFCGWRIFNNVMKNGRGDAFAIELFFSEELGNR